MRKTRDHGAAGGPIPAVRTRIRMTRGPSPFTGRGMGCWMTRVRGKWSTGGLAGTGTVMVPRTWPALTWEIPECGVGFPFLRVPILLLLSWFDRAFGWRVLFLLK